LVSLSKDREDAKDFDLKITLSNNSKVAVE
jgi:hypothetical protein